MKRNNFITAVCCLFGLIAVSSNLICVLIPVVFSFPVPETHDYHVWADFLDENAMFQIVLTIISFGLPSAICFGYLSGIRDGEDTIVRLVNAPIVLALVGTLGWLIQFIVQIALTMYLYFALKKNCWGVLPSSMLFTVLDCILAFTCSYFVLEILNRTFVLKRIFPDGKISRLKGLKKPSISLSFMAYFLGCILFPLVFLIWTIKNIWVNNNIPYDYPIIMSVFFFILVSLGLTLLLMRFFKEPLQNLTHAANRISGGNYTERLSVPSADELGLLADTFNDMQASLKEKDFMRDTFGKVVAPQIRDYLLNNKVSLGGESKVITVMFCDIRSFTSLSEKMPSGDVVRMLNIYFTSMERCISAHGGIINKYIGDCVMAIFGAPVENPDHAFNAYCAALEMLDALYGVNRQFAEMGLPQIRNGIGLHTGTVTAGNIGAENRMEYTVIGDTVNVASRIEELCKEYNKDFLMSSTTAEKVIDHITALIPVPVFFCKSPIRGKEEKVGLWTANYIRHGLR